MILENSKGWEYAFNFLNKFYPKFFASAFVRRRKWSRIRTFNTFRKFIPVREFSYIVTSFKKLYEFN
jgi:hypothetical protein